MAVRNYAALYALLKQMPGVDKESLVLQWTGGRTSSLREMTTLEYNTMIRELRSQVEDLDAKRRARSAVLKQMQLYGIDTTNWEIVDRFCQSPKIAGKRFNRLTLSELQTLRRKLLSIRGKEREKVLHDQTCELAQTITQGQLPN